jgi:hypothetical protein
MKKQLLPEEFTRMQKLAGILTEIKVKPGGRIINNIDVDDDYVEIDSESGDYNGFIEADGTISFSLIEVPDDMGFNDDNWGDILGDDHAFVEIAKSIPTEVETGSDYVMITVKADDLIKHFK